MERENNAYLKSIREILPEDCYETGGSRPVKVFCNDWNEYICKYFTGKGFASALFNEYLAATFLKLWNLRVPDFDFVIVQKHHLKQVKFPYHYFDNPCYGSKFSSNFKEVDKFFLFAIFKNENLERLLDQYLKIGLFDIWLSNEDRNFGNLNLLYDVGNHDFVPIDHVMIFNSNNLDKVPVQITEDESILSAPFMNRNFSRSLQQNSKDLRLTIPDNFSHDVRMCQNTLDQILQQVPPEWGLDTSFITSRLDHYFSKSWLEQSLETFFRYIQIALNPKP